MRKLRCVFAALIVLACPVPGLGGPDGDEARTELDAPEVVRGEAPRCGDDENAAFAYQPIPVVDLPDSFRSGDWWSTSLRRCALRVDSEDRRTPRGFWHVGQPARGFVVHGEPDDSDSAAFDVVFGADRREFYVEIRDDKFVLDADSWLHEDHLEVWTARKRRRDETDDGDGVCMRQEGSPNHWALLLEDGKVVAADGNQAGEVQFEVEDRRDDEDFGGIRLKGLLPEDAGPLVTVVYSDSDDGENQERLIATSDLEHGDGMTLGELDTDSRYECELQNDQLVPSGDPDGVPAPVMAELCGGEDRVDGQSCTRCPDYTALGKSSFENSDSVRPDVEKLEVDGRPAFLASWGRECAPSMLPQRGRVLVVKDEETWKRVDYATNTGSEGATCRKIGVSTPNPTQLCRSNHVNSGHVTTSIGTRVVTRDSLEGDHLLTVSNDGPAMCGEGMDVIELEGIEDVEYNAATETIEIDASALHVSLPDDYEGGLCKDYLDEIEPPDGRDYSLEFPYEDGELEIPEEVDEDGDLKDVPVHEP